MMIEGFDTSQSANPMVEGLPKRPYTTDETTTQILSDIDFGCNDQGQKSDATKKPL